MVFFSSRCLGLLVTCLFLVGCGNEMPPPPEIINTGAKEVAKSFFEALVRKDWVKAYDLIDADSRVRISKEEFTSSAQAALKQLGFNPTEVGVSVTETKDQATAIAVYRGVSGTSSKQFKDGTTLKRIDNTWKVVLRSNFGMDAPEAGKIK